MRIFATFLLFAGACANQPSAPALRVVGMPEPRAPAREVAPETTNTPPAAARWSFASPVVPRERSDIRILMYHSFGWFSEMRPAVTPYALRTQLDFLKDNAIEVIPLGALLDFLEGETLLPEKCTVITIDDGELNGFSVAFPIFRQRNIPFTLALATDAVDRHTTRGTIPWPTLREMLDSGLVTIASHSVTHRNLTLLDDDELTTELEQSRSRIEQELGVRPQAFLYPLGAHDERVRRATARTGYRAGFAAQGGRVSHQSPRFALPRYGVEQSTHLFAFAHYFRHRGQLPR